MGDRSKNVEVVSFDHRNTGTVPEESPCQNQPLPMEPLNSSLHTAQRGRRVARLIRWASSDAVPSWCQEYHSRFGGRLVGKVAGDKIQVVIPPKTATVSTMGENLSESVERNSSGHDFQPGMPMRAEISEGQFVQLWVTRVEGTGLADFQSSTGGSRVAFRCGD